MAQAQYSLYLTLAGWGGNRRWIRTYTNLQSAKNAADNRTGYGHLYIVVDTTNDEVIYRGDRNA